MMWQQVSPRRLLIVALHDVAPPFETDIRTQLKELATIGVQRCVLTVVPNWHGAYPLEAGSSFVDLLQAQLAAGSELVLHGLEHRRHGPLHGTPSLRLRAMLFAGDAAEFLTFTPLEAFGALCEGVDLFTRAGLPRPITFCAPGWLLPKSALWALHKAEIRRVIGMFSLHDLAQSKHLWIPSFGYMGVSPRQEAAIQFFNRLVCGTRLNSAAIAQVYLHPQDCMRRPVFRRIMDTIARMVSEGGWQPTTYAEVCGDD
jgi:predicted deacetylase